MLRSRGSSAAERAATRAKTECGRWAVQTLRRRARLKAKLSYCDSVRAHARCLVARTRAGSEARNSQPFGGLGCRRGIRDPEFRGTGARTPVQRTLARGCCPHSCVAASCRVLRAPLRVKHSASPHHGPEDAYAVHEGASTTEPPTSLMLMRCERYMATP